MKGRIVMIGLSMINPKYIHEAEFETITAAGRASNHQHHKRPNLWLIAAVIAAMLLLMGAAIYTRWSNAMQFRYNPSEEVKQQAEQSGLSVMLDETKGSEKSDKVLSVTDQGITVTAVQTIVDEYRAELTFRIEGFALPEGRIPQVWPLITIDGNEDFYVSQTGNFFDGTTNNEAGEWVYASNGQPVAFGDDHSAILKFAAEDGSLEYTHYIGFQETDGRYLGKEIQVQFRYMGVQSSGMAMPSDHVVDGNWTLHWILTGTDTSISFSPNTEIGDSGVVLLDAQLGQRTIRTRYHVKDFWEGWDELVELPQAIWGVRMKDGSEQMCLPSTSGFEDQESMIYFIESNTYNAILDLSQVESLIFPAGQERGISSQTADEPFIYIPIP